MVVGVVAILGGILANGQNVPFLVALAFAVAASANLPTLLYSLFWKKFNTTGALWSIYGGLASCIILIVFSPVVSGGETSIFGEGVRLRPLPAEQPGHRLDPALVPAGDRRHDGRRPRAGRRGEVRRDGGPAP